MEYTGFDKYELWDCMSLVATKLSSLPTVCEVTGILDAVEQKYEHKKYHSVSSKVRSPSVRSVKYNMKTSADTSTFMMQDGIKKYLIFQDLEESAPACIIM